MFCSIAPYSALRLYSVHQRRGIFVQCLNSLSCFSIIWIERDGQVAVVVVAAAVVAAVVVAVAAVAAVAAVVAVVVAVAASIDSDRKSSLV